MKKKIYSILFVIFSFIFTTRYWGANEGLPYLYHWDEVITSTSALNILKTGDIRPRYVENVYGGFMRYSDLFIDVIHYQYLKLTGQIESKADIKTNLEGEFRTLSHPSFYLWNRVFSILISLGCIWMVYRIVRLILPNNYYPAVASVLLLSVSTNHFQESRFTLPNVPMAFWTMVTLYMSLKFHVSKKIKYLFLALIGGGIGTATKLSGALTLFLPLAVFLFNLSLHKKYTNIEKILLLILLGITPILCFLMWTPSIFIDFEQWWHWNLWQIKDYNDPNSGQFKKTPGFENLSYQIDLFKQDIGLSLLVLSTIGAVSYIFQPKESLKYNKILYLSLIVGFPVAYVLYFTNQIVAYHRNYMVIYPFLAIWFGIFCNFLGNILNHFFKNKNILNYDFVISSVLLIMFGMSYFQTYKIITETAWRCYTTPDTRSKMVDYINQNYPNKNIVAIANELQFSEYDLQKLRIPYTVFRHKEIDSFAKRTTIMLVGDYGSFDKSRHAYDDTLNRLTQKYTQLYEEKGNKMFCDLDPVIRQTPHINPTVKILKANSYENAKLYPSYIHKNIVQQILYTNESKGILYSGMLDKGKYKVKIIIWGTPNNDIYPRVIVTINDKKLSPFYINKDKNKEYEFDINVEKKSMQTYVLSFDNDAYDERGDRNLFIEQVAITRIPE